MPPSEPVPSIEPSSAVGSMPPLVPGRECGDCNVCCIALTIDDPALRKVQGVRCGNAQPDNRCVVYANRPGTCRTFYCGWRRLKWVRVSLRPDLAGILVRLAGMKIEGTPVKSIVFTLLREDALHADGVAEALATAVTTGYPVFLEVVGAPGYTYGAARMDEVLSLPVGLRDKAGVLSLLRQAWTEGRAGPHRAIVMDQEAAGRQWGDAGGTR